MQQYMLLLNQFLRGSAKTEQMLLLVRSQIRKLIAGHLVGDKTVAILFVVGDDFSSVLLEDLPTILVILARRVLTIVQSLCESEWG